VNFLPSEFSQLHTLDKLPHCFGELTSSYGRDTILNSILQKIQRRDITILKVVNTSMNCRLLDFIMTPITYLGSTIFSILFCLTALFHPNETITALGLKTCITLSISTLISRFIKTYVSRVRPFIKLNNLNIKKIGIDAHSFPSGHTTAAFSIATTTSLFYPNISIIIILLASCVGISRMYLGVHYPTDVLAGTFLGTLTSFFTFYII